ncbi:uncharacterized protein [Montipora capricornis]|uniref:uncharacterized protein n=1 Tax=Montipora capricornis TaxID=246305 RepID=UPI0035F1A3A9
MTCAEYFPGKTAVSWKRGLLSLIVYNKSCEKNCQSMGRREFIGGQFSSKYQPAKKLKSEEKPDENSCSVGGQDSAATTPESVFLKFARELARIDKLSRECKRLTSENAGLKRTIQTLRKSIVFLRRRNSDLKKETLTLQKQVTKQDKLLKTTSLKKNDTIKKLRGAKSVATKLKNQLKQKGDVLNSYYLVDTFAHGKNGANHRSVMFMACIRYLQHACLLSNQKAPIALHLIFSILFNCSPPKNLIVSPTTLSDWNVLLDKLILCKRFANSKYDFHVWSDDSNKGGKERHIVGVHTWCHETNKPRAYVLANSIVASGSEKHQSDVDFHIVHDTFGISNVSGLVGDNASTQKGKLNRLIANNSKLFGREMFFVGCYPHILNIMLRRMCQAGFGAKGDMNNNHVLQLLYKISWLHHERPSQYKAMYVSLGILSKEPPLPQSFIETRWTYYHEMLQWYFKYGKACLQLAERILERMPKSDNHSSVWQNVIKLSSCPMIQVQIKFLFEFLDKFIIPSLNSSQASDEELGFSSGYLARLWPATVLKHNETLSQMLLCPSLYFPLTEEQVQLSFKDPAAIKHFYQEVQRPMLQEALKVIKEHGAEWLSFPKLFEMGADQRFQSPFWSSVLKVLDIQFVSTESNQGNASENNVKVYGQDLQRLVSKDRNGLVKWANHLGAAETSTSN